MTPISKTPQQVFGQIGGRQRLPLDHRDGVLDHSADHPRPAGIDAEDVSATGDTFLGFEIDEQQRGGADGAGAGAEHEGHWEMLTARVRTPRIVRPAIFAALAVSLPLKE